METHFCRHRQIREQKYEKRNKKQLKSFKMTMIPNTLKNDLFDALHFTVHNLLPTEITLKVHLANIGFTRLCHRFSKFKATLILASPSL